MSETTVSHGVELAKAPVALKTPILLTALALVVLWFFGFASADVDVSILWSAGNDTVQLAPTVVNAKWFGIIAGFIMLAIAAGSFVWEFQRKKYPIIFPALAGGLFVAALLMTSANGGTVDIIYIFGYTLTGSVAVILGAMAGVIGERVGVVNIAIEGQLLSGAFVAALVANITGNLYLGLIAAAVGAGLVSLILAAFAIKYFVEQIIIGVVINLLVAGITGFLFSTLRRGDFGLMGNPGTLPTIKIPLLSDIPVLGPIFFTNNLTTFMMMVLVAVVWYVLFKSKLGLRIRAIGEHPLAADTVGLNVNRTRFWTVTVAGMIAGIGGAALSIGSVGAFGSNMSAGQGFIALAVVILGRWHPLYAAAAALLFGFSQIFRIWAVQTGSPIPPDLVQATPYVVTLLAVTLLVGKSVPPAAVGQPYVKNG